MFRKKTICSCSFLQHDRVKCLSNDILVCFNKFNFLSTIYGRLESLLSNRFAFSQSDVQDIEDIVKLGHELNTCPLYYAKREAYGIEMYDNVGIIDEAYNLSDAILLCIQIKYLKTKYI